MAAANAGKPLRFLFVSFDPLMVRRSTSSHVIFNATDKSDRVYPPVTGPLRKLTVNSSSILLDRFDRTLEKVGNDSPMGTMSTLRIKGFNAHHLIYMIERPGDPDTFTVLQKLRFLIVGSPVLRYIYHQASCQSSCKKMYNIRGSIQLKSEVSSFLRRSPGGSRNMCLHHINLKTKNKQLDHATTKIKVRQWPREKE